MEKIFIISFYDNDFSNIALATIEAITSVIDDFSKIKEETLLKLFKKTLTDLCKYRRLTRTSLSGYSKLPDNYFEMCTIKGSYITENFSPWYQQNYGFQNGESVFIDCNTRNCGLL